MNGVCVGIDEKWGVKSGLGCLVWGWKSMKGKDV